MLTPPWQAVNRIEHEHLELWCKRFPPIFPCSAVFEPMAWISRACGGGYGYDLHAVLFYKPLTASLQAVQGAKVLLLGFHLCCGLQVKAGIDAVNSQRADTRSLPASIKVAGLGSLSDTLIR